jgi:hypothetical protein
MTVDGIDVSHWQSTTPSLSGLGFLFARKSIGTTQDEKYALHIGNARRAGLLTGAYHFNWSSTSIADQVRAFLANAGDVDFYALDVEVNRHTNSDGSVTTTPQFTKAQAHEFIDRVQATGRECGLYMSDSGFYSDVGQDWNWVANWSNRPSRPFRFWQYHGGPIDRNRFDGTLAQLRALAAGGSAGGKEDAVKGFTAPGAPKQYAIPKDRVLYRSSDLTADPLNIVGHPPITGLYLGATRTSDGRLVRIVSYDSSSDTAGPRAYFVNDADVAIKDWPMPAADCSALQAEVDQLNAELAKIHTETTLSEGIGWDAGIQAGIEALTALPKKGSIGGAG